MPLKIDAVGTFVHGGGTFFHGVGTFFHGFYFWRGRGQKKRRCYVKNFTYDVSFFTYDVIFFT